MPIGNIPGWHQVFADNFANDHVPVGGFSGCTRSGYAISANTCSALPHRVARKWWAYPDGWSDHSGGTYYPSKVLSIQNGMLNYHMHTENGVHLVSAPVPKIPGGAGREGGRLYGRYVVRFRADALPGYKTAFLLWPDSETSPRDGEIDFPEGDLNGTISSFMHWQGALSGTGAYGYFLTSATYTSWHTAVIEWRPSFVRYTLDGNVMGSFTSHVPSGPMHWVLQAQVAQSGVPSNTTGGNVQIDWVAVYAPA